MSFDQKTRNLLQRTVSACRKILDEEFAAQRRKTYGINDDGSVAPLELLGHLPDEEMQTARLLRDRLDHLAAGLTTQGKKESDARKEAVGRLTREQAFTVLNRLAALRMAEEREIVLECVRNGLHSEGFLLFQQTAGSAFGETWLAYRAYLLVLFDELAIDLGVLFSRWDPTGLLFPGKDALEAVLKELGGTGTAMAREDITPEEFNAIWSEDETIGWIYQYYNDQAERKKMREESSAPRNSRELAVRNQFFTPRYVVEFLTDNTLGRIWYEMTRGETRLKEQCRYLVRRPNEIFLDAGDEAKAPPSFEERLDSIIGDPEEAYRKVFPEVDPVDYTGPYGWVEEAYHGQFRNLLEDASDPDTRWVGAAIPPDQIDRILGEHWKPLDDQPKLDRLTESILSGNPEREACKLPVVWAILSAYARTSQYDGGYGSEHWEKLWSHFRSIAQSCEKFGVIQSNSDLSQEELLKQPVHIPNRPIKDPRTILMLDPACGSMHFGLYAFDLFEVIYDEAWALEEKLGADALSRLPGMKSLHATYAGKDAFLKDVPRLTIEHNLHGIDIDPRCAQIAGLSLWLRAQKAWQRLGLKPEERPAIKRSNIVCAEPMPGEKELLREFVEREFPAAERAVCLRLLEAIFDKMQLAGEAGSLLKIEEEIRSAIEDARDAWQKLATKPPELFTTTELNELSTAPELTGLEQAVSSLTTDPRHLTTDFWERIEERIYAALRDYAEQAENGGGFQRRLFAEDAARGFAFIDVCRKHYDVVLMNPPFGEASVGSRKYLYSAIPSATQDLFAAFVERFGKSVCENGRIGVISNRLALFKDLLDDWRRELFLGGCCQLRVVSDLGYGVLDGAVVEAAGYVLARTAAEHPLSRCSFLTVLDTEDKETALLGTIRCLLEASGNARYFEHSLSSFKGLPNLSFAYWCSEAWLARISKWTHAGDAGVVAKKGLETGDDFRYLRLLWEVPNTEIAPLQRWTPFSKGGPYQPTHCDLHLAFDWANRGQARRTSNDDLYGLPGLTYTERTTSNFAVRVLPRNSLFSPAGPVVLMKEVTCPWGLLGLLNSSVIAFYIELFVGGGDTSVAGTAARHFSPSLIEDLPIPAGLDSLVEKIAPHAQVQHDALRKFRVAEPSGYFCGLAFQGTHITRQKLNHILAGLSSPGALGSRF